MKKIYFSTLLLISATYFSIAQTKTAHLNYKQLVESLPAYKQAQDSLVKITNSYEAELKHIQEEYKIKTEAFAKDSMQMQALIKDQKRKEIKLMEDNYVSFRENAQKDIDAKREIMIDPLVNKIREVIIAVAKEKGYSYVMDDNTQGYIYMSDVDNIADAVKKKLGITK